VWSHESDYLQSVVLLDLSHYTYGLRGFQVIFAWLLVFVLRGAVLIHVGAHVSLLGCLITHFLTLKEHFLPVLLQQRG
jgi:uncharacterized membrane protein